MERRISRGSILSPMGPMTRHCALIRALGFPLEFPEDNRGPGLTVAEKKRFWIVPMGVLSVVFTMVTFEGVVSAALGLSYADVRSAMLDAGEIGTYDLIAAGLFSAAYLYVPPIALYCYSGVAPALQVFVDVYAEEFGHLVNNGNSLNYRRRGRLLKIQIFLLRRP